MYVRTRGMYGRDSIVSQIAGRSQSYYRAVSH
jgi:hypothetical protein